MLYIILFALLYICAGLFNGQMDYIKENQLDSESWKNKWYWNITVQYGKHRLPYESKWYYFGLYKPEFKERFPFSSTILVFTTDKWHLFKWCMFLCIEVLISINTTLNGTPLNWWQIIIAILVLKSLRGFGFGITHAKDMHG